MGYVVIVENDESPWNDKTGAVYHFPKRYQKLLLPGTQLLYYKGTMKNLKFASTRKSKAPYYFATAKVREVRVDPKNRLGALFALIEDFTEFDSAVLAKENGLYLETIPASRKSNYWGSSVREISKADYERIIYRAAMGAKVTTVKDATSSDYSEFDVFESHAEGKPGMRYGTVYERNRKLRAQAIAIHGTACHGCGFDFERVYGVVAQGFIHVHHINPLSSVREAHSVNPQTDLVPLCPNCHAVVHLDKTKTLSIGELKDLVNAHSS